MLVPEILKLVHIEQFSSRDDFQFRLSPNGAYAAIIARDPQNHYRFQGGVWSPPIDKNGARLASGGLDRAVKVWDVAAALKAAKESTLALAAVKPVAATPKANTPIATAPKANTPIAAAPKPNTPPASAAAATPKSFNPKVETNSIGMKLLSIPPGEFQMGTPDESRVDTDPGERPLHLVRLTKPTTIGIHEVTVGQFRAFVNATKHATDAEKEGAGSTGYDPAAKRFVEEENRPEFTWKNIGIAQSEDCPVTNVSWNDAKAFCVWLSGKEGKCYRLPTEAEWEYCCYAGAKTRFSTGEAAESVIGHGNFADASLREKWPAALWSLRSDDGFPFTAPVGEFKANAFGLYDMVGNVAEWCEDYYDPTYYAQSPPADPPGAYSGDRRVVRGGSWYNDESGQRPAMRVPGWPPTWRSALLGFRVVRE